MSDLSHAKTPVEQKSSVSAADLSHSNPAPEPEALKACPFCGNERPSLTHDGNGVHWVCCMRCEAEGRGADTPGEAVAYWNTRPAEDHKADEGTLESWKKACEIAVEHAKGYRSERDALRAQIERLTSDEAVEAAYQKWVSSWTKDKSLAKAAITEAVRLAGEMASAEAATASLAV